jgi:hypothetical protein
MSPTRIVRRLLISLIMLAFLPCLPAQQGGQTGSGTGSSTGGSTGTSTTPATGSRNTPTQQQPSTANQPPLQRQWLPYVTGSVVMEDGSPLPSNVVIERVCNSRPKREAFLNASGFFSFQIGSANSLMMDASVSGEAGTDSPWGPIAGSPATTSTPSSSSSADWIGCELRAELPGYRSTVAILKRGQMVGQILEVGTLVLYPISKIRGTTISATSMQASKEAKKAFERGDKALRKQQFEDAIKDLQVAVQIYSKYAAAWLGLGQAYQQQRRFDDSRSAFSKALEADSNYVNPYIELARLASQEQKWQEVVDLTDRALALDPLDFPDGFVLNSLANFYLNNLEAAERSARKAQRLDSVHRLPQGHLILASILQRKQDFAGEAEQLRNFLKYAPAATNADRVRSRLLELEKIGIAAGKQPSSE